MRFPKDNPFANRGKMRGARFGSMAFATCGGSRLIEAPASCGRAMSARIHGRKSTSLRRGGNYGWNLREATHPFGPKGSPPRADMIEPIWEYNHSVGKSIIGGSVYRGKSCPALEGAYMYADYVTGPDLGAVVRSREKASDCEPHDSKEGTADFVVWRGRRRARSTFSRRPGGIYKFASP